MPETFERGQVRPPPTLPLSVKPFFAHPRVRKLRFQQALTSGHHTQSPPIVRSALDILCEHQPTGHKACPYFPGACLRGVVQMNRLTESRGWEQTYFHTSVYLQQMLFTQRTLRYNGSTRIHTCSKMKLTATVTLSFLRRGNFISPRY